MHLRGGILLLGVLALLAAHGVILEYVAAHTRLSLLVIGGLAALVLIKHLGLFGSAYAALRSRQRRQR